LHMDARARVWLELARAGSRHDSLAAELSVALDPHVDAADPAHAGRGLGRQVAHRWDGDPELLGGVEDRGVARYAYHLAVDRDLYQLVTHAEPPTPAFGRIGQVPAGQRRPAGGRSLRREGTSAST